MTTPTGSYGMVLSRRHWLRCSFAAGLSMSGWLPNIAAQAVNNPARRRSCILLWMAGGPTQTDTFDPKPGHANGGPFATIQTRTPGIRVAEHLPLVARQSDQLAIIRSMRTREGDHGRATYHLRTGYVSMPPIQFPTMGSLVAKEREQPNADLPGYVSIGAPFASAAGFLGPRYAPLMVGQEGEIGFSEGESNSRVQNAAIPASVGRERFDQRRSLARELETEFLDTRPGIAGDSYRFAYNQAERLMSPAATQAFDISRESASVRDSYGRSRFGQSCLLARRLVERGVPFVEVSLGGWDTHDNNFNAVRNLCSPLDAGWSGLMNDLRTRGLLDSTLVVWMGEFGRTPIINPRNGRDHYPAAWSVVLGGGGIRGGQAYGRTSASGGSVEESPVSVGDLMATICVAMGLDPTRQNMSNVGRPIRLAEYGAEPVRAVLS